MLKKGSPQIKGFLHKVNTIVQSRMNPQLMLLRDLQRIDNEKMTIKAFLEEKPLQLKQREELLNNERKQHEKLISYHKDLQLQIHKKELALKVIEDNLNKLHQKIYHVKTQKEAEALDKEIAEQKKEHSQTEEELLSLMFKLDEVKEQIEESSARLAQSEAEFAQLKQQTEIELIQSKAQLEHITRQREELLPKLDVNLLRLYEQLQNKCNQAVVKVEGNVCQGCHMSIATQIINQLCEANSIIRCEYCLRILYLDSQ